MIKFKKDVREILISLSNLRTFLIFCLILYFFKKLLISLWGLYVLLFLCLCIKNFWLVKIKKKKKKNIKKINNLFYFFNIMDCLAFSIVSQSFKFNKNSLYTFCTNILFRIVTGCSVKLILMLSTICSFKVKKLKKKKNIKIKMFVHLKDFTEFLLSSYEKIYDIATIKKILEFKNNTHIYMYEVSYPCEIIPTKNGYIYYNINIIEVCELDSRAPFLIEKLSNFFITRGCDVLSIKKKKNRSWFYFNKNETWEMTLNNIILGDDIISCEIADYDACYENKIYVQKFTQLMNDLSKKYLNTPYKEKHTYWYLENYISNNGSYVVKNCKITHDENKILIESKYDNIFNVLALTVLKCVNEENELPLLKSVVVRHRDDSIEITYAPWLLMHNTVLTHFKNLSKYADVQVVIKWEDTDHRTLTHLIPYAEDTNSTKDSAWEAIREQLKN